MFEEAYGHWLASQRRGRKGESLRKLDEDHGHAEKLFLQEAWWPAVGNLDYLFAEHEVANYRNSSYYLDLAYIRSPYKLDLEIDDFSSHAKNVTRRGFEYEKERQNQLIDEDWKVYRFSLDTLKERPLHCQQSVLRTLGRLYGGKSTAQTDSRLPLKQREILRMSIRLERPITPIEVCVQLGIGNRLARMILHELVEKELLENGGGGSMRTRNYRITLKGRSMYLD
ncbi:DNA-binding response regulator [Cohnella luojiensis]|uniref:DNA-binding response regulator n=1 Tax=Cohnella luojiensis TaxID=652876 RepID=A0A4Y8M2L9_9BACL|nr:DNA-binding response regulator [Cohnella luojiensis]TFE26925.1 DNA-binding response regulator [Cohnella luojiensis]